MTTKDPVRRRAQQLSAQQRARERERLTALGLPIPPELQKRKGGRKPKATAPKRRKPYTPAPVTREDTVRKRIRQLLAFDEYSRGHDARVVEDESATRTLIASGDVAALASNSHFAAVVGQLEGRLRASRSVTKILFAGDCLPWRLGCAFGIIQPTGALLTANQTLCKIRNAKGPNADMCRALLSGMGHADAVLLRRVIEARRGSALPMFDLTGGEP